MLFEIEKLVFTGTKSPWRPTNLLNLLWKRGRNTGLADHAAVAGDFDTITSVERRLKYVILRLAIARMRSGH